MMAKSGGMLNAICAKLLKAPVTTENETAETNATNDCQNDRETSPSDFDFETDKENNNKPLLLSKHREQSPIGDDGGRKNRRKSGKPRNITQFKVLHEESFDELEEYELNNKGVDFEEVLKEGENEEEEEDYVLDLSRPIESESFVEQGLDLSNGASTQNEDTFSHDESGILDLTVNKSHHQSDENHHGNQDRESMATGPVAMDTHEHSTDSLSAAQIPRPAHTNSSPNAHSHINGQSPSAEPTDANAIKDFAQSTMSELLGMYGLSSEVESITKNVPLQNFASGSILSRNQDATPTKPKPFIPNVPNVFISNPLALSIKQEASKPSPAATDLSGQTQSSPAPLVSSTQPSNSIATNQNLYAKFANNINKLAAAAQGKNNFISKFFYFIQFFLYIFSICACLS